jgi:hypothetical protein
MGPNAVAFLYKSAAKANFGYATTIRCHVLLRDELLALKLFYIRCRPLGVKSKSVRIGVHGNIAKARPFEARGEHCRIDGDTGVVPVNDAQAKFVEADAVDSGEDTSGLQHSAYFTKEFVLEFRGIDVVQHMQTDGAGKLSVLKWYGSGIAMNYGDVGVVRTSGQGGGERGINFERGDMLDFFA